jgi:putative ABC transport system permease protein
VIGRLREIADRISAFLRGRGREDDLEDEMSAHLDLAAAENLDRGMDLEGARRAAQLRFGSRASLREEIHEQSGLPGLESWLRDFSYAFRGLRKNPGFTAVAVAILATGIGINTAVFTVTKAALFAGFPMVAGNDRILYLSSSRGCCVSYPDFLDWQAQARSFQGMAIVVGTSGILSDDTSAPESYDATEVSAGTFRLIGQQPLLGRDFTPADEMQGAPHVAILSYGLWQRRFGKNPSVLGLRIRMNGQPATVVGIMPPGFSFPQKLGLWFPMVKTPDLLRARGARNKWFAFGRLADGVSPRMARSEMEVIGRRLGEAYPRTNLGRNLLPHVQTFSGFFILENETAIYWAIWGAVAFVLAIACANLANLSIARALERSREISVRIALGAARWRIARQLLTESLVLTAAGTSLGLLIAQWAVRAYAAADRGPGRSSWRILDYSLDYRVFGYLTAISCVTALLLALAPLRRLSKLDIGATLKDGDRGATGGRRGNRLSGLLVTAEFALAVILLAGAGVTIRSFLALYTANLGVNTDNVITMAVTLPQRDYADGNSRVLFFDRIRAGLGAIPGVESVTTTSNIPSAGASRLAAEAEGQAGDAEHSPTVLTLTIGPAYFRTLRANLFAGRDFTETDRPAGTAAAIVNERLAREHWPGADPLGKRLRLLDGKTIGPWLTVVGVAPEISQNGPRRRGLDTIVYVPFAQNPAPGMTVIARTRVRPEALAHEFRQEMQTVEARAVVFGPVSMNERLRSNYWSSGLYGTLFLIFAAVALSMASVGLFAAIAYSVGRRTKEIGIRMAIGATRRDIWGLVLREGMFPAGIGLVLGLGGTLVLNPVLKSVLVQVSPTDSIALAGSSAILLIAAALGCAIPARRATRIDPMSAIRHE